MIPFGDLHGVLGTVPDMVGLVPPSPGVAHGPGAADGMVPDGAGDTGVRSGVTPITMVTGHTAHRDTPMPIPEEEVHTATITI